MKFTRSPCGPFAKSKERIKKFKETGDSRYIYQSEHNMVYEDYKYLNRRTFADKILRDKAFNIAKDPKFDGYQRGLVSMVYKYFDEKTSGSGLRNIPNKELAEELHKPIIRKFKKEKVQSPFIGNVWGADLADMELTGKFNKGIRFLLCFIDIYSKCAWVIPLKVKKCIIIINVFQKILKESNHKPNKIWG